MMLAAACLTVPFADAPILLNGRCDEPQWMKAAEVRMSNDSRVLLLHDRDYVYFCAVPAPGDGAAFDIFVGHEDRTIQLHVSAQVGERLLVGNAEPPWDWNNHKGWYGIPTPLVALERGPDGRTHARYLQESDRETAVSKSRFGRLPWKVRLSVTSFGQGKAHSAEFPVSSTLDSQAGWVELRGEGFHSSQNRLDIAPDGETGRCPETRPLPC